jgi:serine/threonine-protein kinase
MYEMFTGAVPFTGETFLGVLTKHLSDPAPTMRAIYPELAISPQLEAVILRALEKDPNARYQTMLEFAQAITGTQDAAALGYRPTVSSLAEHSMSVLPHVPGTPTAQQFMPATSTAATAAGHADRSAETLAKPGVTAARIETQLGAEATPRLSGGRSLGGLALAALAVVVLGGGGALFAMKRGSSTTPTPEPGAPADGKAVASAPSATAPRTSESATSQPVQSAEAAKSTEVTATVTPASSIRLEVSSEPTGATLSKNGFQVCDSTPCEVLAAPNETLEFEATKGALKGSAKVLAQRDQKVAIKLSGGAAAPKHSAAAAEPRMCEVEVDGLKILRPCK